MPNRFGNNRLGQKQRKLLQLMFDNHGVWPKNLYLSYVDIKIMESLEKRGFIVMVMDGFASYKLNEHKITVLKELYGMKEVDRR